MATDDFQPGVRVRLANGRDATIISNHGDFIVVAVGDPGMADVDKTQAIAPEDTVLRFCEVVAVPRLGVIGILGDMVETVA